MNRMNWTMMLTLLITTAIGMWAFTVESTVPDTGNVNPKYVSMAVPANFPAPVLDETNPLTEEGIALGRQLFYDTRLSADEKVSCASCHRQELAFSDGIALSRQGVSKKHLERHAPVLMNLAWVATGFFWDGGATNLESQAFGPLTHSDEMGMDLWEMEERIKEDDSYRRQFEIAFDDTVNSANIVKALAQFERTLISANSRYDRYMRHEGEKLSTAELKGLALFQTHCSSCHSNELFTDNQFHNNGLDHDFSNGGEDDIYWGRYRISYQKKDMGAYRTPTLRNIMVSAPYMHDGRYADIYQVLDHYRKNIQESPYTDPILYQQKGALGIPLNDQEVAAIVAFLKTLTDASFLHNPAFSAP